MITEDGKHLYISAAEYHDVVEQLAVHIYRSQWDFDVIVCLARGGLRVGDILSRLFKKPLAILAVSSYRDDLGHIQNALLCAPQASIAIGRIAGKVLLVDDLVDSGATFAAVERSLKEQHPITELRTAVMWHKAASSIKPDYCVQELPSNPWIHQPFEIYDRVSLAELAQKW